MNFLTTPIISLPATVAQGETLETINAKRNLARVTTRRVLTTQRKTEDLAKIEAAEEKADNAFAAFHLAFYGKAMKVFVTSSVTAYYC